MLKKETRENMAYYSSAFVKFSSAFLLLIIILYLMGKGEPLLFHYLGFGILLIISIVTFFVVSRTVPDDPK